MDLDWGGQGPANIRSGSTCGDLGTDKCAQITGGGSFTSTQGIPNTGTTFIQTIDISDLDFDDGGRTTYSIAVDKNDAADSISFHITGKDGSTVSFAGTDTLSAAGVDSDFEIYTGGFDFAGGLTSLIVEVAGRDINLSIGPLFDDVQINVLFNVISTIITEGITTIETFIALETFDDVTIDIATDIFVNNNVSIGPTGDIEISPIDDYAEPGPSYDDVAAEIETELDMGGMAEYDDASYDTDVGMGEMDMDMGGMGEDSGGYEMEPVTTDSIETEMMAEVDYGSDMDMDMPDVDMPEPEPSETTVASVEPEPEPEVQPTASEPEPEPEPETAAGESEPEPEPEPETSEPEPEEAEPEPEEAEPEPEPESEPEPQEAEEESEPETKVAKAEEKKEEPKAEAKAKPKSQQEKKQEAKQKAANKIVKKMGDKGRYDDNNQTKTLVIMQVLGNTKDFFDQGSVLRDAEVFYEVTSVPDTVISDNNYAQYMLFGGSDAAHDELTNLQYEDQ